MFICVYVMTRCIIYIYIYSSLIGTLEVSVVCVPKPTTKQTTHTSGIITVTSLELVSLPMYHEKRMMLHQRLLPAIQSYPSGPLHLTGAALVAWSSSLSLLAGSRLLRLSNTIKQH